MRFLFRRCKWPFLKRQGSICAPHDRLSSFVGYDSKDGVVLIFLLAVFTLTSKRGGEVAGIDFFQSFHSKENNFSLNFFSQLEFS